MWNQNQGGNPWRQMHQQGDNFNYRGGGGRGGFRGRGGRGRGRGRGGGSYKQASNETNKPTDYRSYVLPQMTQNPWAKLEAELGIPPATVASAESSSSA